MAGQCLNALHGCVGMARRAHPVKGYWNRTSSETVSKIELGTLYRCRPRIRDYYFLSVRKMNVLLYCFVKLFKE